MKVINEVWRKTVVLGVLLVGMASQGFAQWDMRKLNLTVDWQMNAPLSSDFTDKISGWGMNYELAYEVTPRWNVGVFAAFHTNHKYIGRQTLELSPTESITTDQQRSAFQVPLGLTGAYTVGGNSYLKPYVGAKMGAMFARNSTYFGAGGLQDKKWGFYVSPEVGLKIHPTAGSWGLHVAGYYSYATNQTHTLTCQMDGQSNIGFRLGVIF